MNFHTQMMNTQVDGIRIRDTGIELAVLNDPNKNVRVAYRIGFADALRAVSGLAIAADKEIEQLRARIEVLEVSTPG